MRLATRLLLIGSLFVSMSCGGGSNAPFVPSGSLLTYLSTAGSTNSDHCYGVATFADGSCVITGEFFGTCSFGLGEPGVTTLVSVGSFDMFVARYNGDGSLAWARRAGGAARDNGSAVAAFPDGACVVTGRFTDIATFGAGTPTETMLTELGGVGDIFVVRYEADGSMAWAKRAGRDDTDFAAAIAGFADGSFVITGLFETAATFGPGEPGQILLTSNGNGDYFVARYNADGTIVWARSAGSLGDEYGRDIAVLPDGSCLVAGYFASVPVTFGPGDPNQTVLTSAGGSDVFIARHNADGTLAWVKQAGGTSPDRADGISVFPDQSFVVCGVFEDTAVFGPGEPGQISIPTITPGDNDVFVARYQANGNVSWVRRGGGSNFDIAQSIRAHPDGSCVVAGEYQGIAVFGQGEVNETFLLPVGDTDAFLARYGATGALQWARGAGGSLGQDRCFHVDLHADGTWAVCGDYVDNAIFNIDAPGAQLVFGNDPVLSDMFVARYTAAGGL